jgi:hypothetical protein
MEGIRETSTAYQDLTNRLDDTWIADWTAQEQNAMEECGDTLKIYVISSDNGTVQSCCNDSKSHPRYPAVPTLADIRLKLSKREVHQGNLFGTVSTLMEGLAIERSQCVTFFNLCLGFWLTLL